MRGEADRQRVFPVTVEETVATARWLDDIAAAEQIPGDTAFAMQLCLEELLGNILRHGGLARTAKVAVSLSGNIVRMILEDDGPPFDVAAAPVKHVTGPLEDLEPGGLGIGLVHDFSSGLEYARAGLGNRVTVDFAMSPGPGARQ